MRSSRHTIILIRNAQPYDFGGGERFPTFVGDVLKNTTYTPLIISASNSVKDFARAHSIPVIDGVWWKNQDWSGPRLLFFPIYVLWQLFLTLYYLLIFIQKKPLAIHIQSKDDFIAATLAGRAAGANVIWTDHADLKHIWLNLRVWYKNPVGKLVYCAARLANSIVAVSKNEARLITKNLSAHSFVWNKMELIHNGCTDVHDTITRSTYPVFTFCIANRLVTDKGIGETIDAFEKIHSDFPDTQLLILGDGPEADDFKVRAKKTDGIKFLGHQDNPYSIMASSDVFLQPTHHDAFSVVIVEASMLGLPIVATSIGGNVEIIFEGETGLLVPVKDSSALYRAMKKLRTDSDLRKNLAKGARENYLKNFRFEDIVINRYIPLYSGTPPHGLTEDKIL